MKHRKFKLLTILLTLAFLIMSSSAYAEPTTGAIWTTDESGDRVNQNIYNSKDDVFLNGGPNNDQGGNSLADGDYYIQVTTPGGDVLGKSCGTVTVQDGKFTKLIQLSSFLYTDSSGFEEQGYNDTTNPGGEYKVWASRNSEFPSNESKTDNFKVKSSDPEEPKVPEEPKDPKDPEQPKEPEHPQKPVEPDDLVIVAPVTDYNPNYDDKVAVLAETDQRLPRTGGGVVPFILTGISLTGLGVLFRRRA